MLPKAMVVVLHLFNVTYIVSSICIFYLFASEALGLGLYVYFMWNLPGLMAGVGTAKVCSDGLDYVTKPATMSIYGKTLLKIFFRIERPMTLELCMWY